MKAVLKPFPDNIIHPVHTMFVFIFVGFDPKIPGYDRYSVISNSVDEFNLNIVNTQLSDDGTFECQVMPTDGNPPLRTTAVLTILGKL